MNYAAIISRFSLAVLGGICARGASLFSLLMSTRALDPVLYARLALILSAVTIATTVCGMGLRQVLALDYVHYTEHDRFHLITEIIIYYGIIITVAAPLYFLGLASHMLVLSFAEATTIFFIVISNFFIELFYQVLQYEQKTLRLLVLQGAASCIIVILSYLFLFCYPCAHEGILYAQTAAYAFVLLFALQCIMTVLRQTPLHVVSSRLCRARFFSGIPFIPAIAFSWVLYSGNRWLLSLFVTSHEVGNYALAENVYQIFQACILTPWSITYFPFFLSLYAKNPADIARNERHNQKIMITAITICLVGLFCLYTSAKPFVLALLSPQYHHAYNLVLPLSIGQIFLFGSYFCSCIIHFLRKKYFIALSLCFPACLQMSLSYYALSYGHGSMGCAYASAGALGSYWIISCIYACFLTRAHNFTHEKKELTLHS